MAAVMNPTGVGTGGGFLCEGVGSAPIFSPERFTEEQRMFFRTAEAFSKNDVLSRADAIEAKEAGLLAGLVRRAGELGPLMVDIPQAYGGLGGDKATSMPVAEAMN